MRWLVFILFLMPNFAVADKITRDKFLIVEDYAGCVELIQQWIGVETASHTEFENWKLIIKFEIDETLFSEKQVNGLMEILNTHLSNVFGGLDGVKEAAEKLNEQETLYIELKVKQSKDDVRDEISKFNTAGDLADKLYECRDRITKLK